MESAVRASAFGLSAIGQIAITVNDVDRAAAFYRDALGTRPLFQVPGMAFFDCGAAYETLAGQGMPGHDLWLAFFRDPDRNLLALMSEVPRA